MIKDYTLDDGTTFQTVTIPKGTVLFRGLDYTSNDGYYKLFYDLIGVPSPGGYCVAPKSNIFFYPAPYILQMIGPFNVHIVYVTNYDLELLLLIKPSQYHRGDRKDDSSPLQQIIKTCTSFGKMDGCGTSLSDDDPCFTDLVLQQYPHILGYIAIANTDKDKLHILMRDFVKHYRADKLIHILPSIASNARDSISVPEIVLHPHHLRMTYPDYHNVRDRNYNTSAELINNFIIRHKNRFNYFPLFYVTGKDIYTLIDLKNRKYIDQIRETVVNSNTYFINKPLFQRMNTLITKLLSREGYKRDGYRYQITVNLTTDFYVVRIQSLKPTLNSGQIQGKSSAITRRNENKKFFAKLNTSDGMTDTKDKIPFSYTLDQKKALMKTLYNSSFQGSVDDFERSMNSNGLSLEKQYLFNKGKKRNAFRVMSVFQRPDLQQKSKQYASTRKKNRETIVNPENNSLNLEEALSLT